MAETYRRFIRINGKVVGSPKFERKADADRWYKEQEKVKDVLKGQLKHSPLETTFMQYAIKIINERLKTHGYATWVSDEQRMRDYLLPELSEIPMHKITPQKLKRVLKKITDSGLSVSTRDRVKALVSAIFKSALNEDPPLVAFNPVSQIQFSEKRVGKPKPKYFPHIGEVEQYLTNAKGLGSQYLAFAALAVMTGLRKSEMLALQWSDIDFEHRQINVSKRVVQANLTVSVGTKRGENESRIVPMARPVVSALKDWRRVSEFPDGFLFYKVANPNRGRFVNPRTLSDWHEECLKGLPRRVTVHGLRHTYGREFVKRGGSLKRLQAIMGHSSINTTSLYSDLADETHESVADLVSFKIGKSRKKRG